MDNVDRTRLQADGRFIEPRGYIQWDEWDVNT